MKSLFTLNNVGKAFRKLSETLPFEERVQLVCARFGLDRAFVEAAVHVLEARDPKPPKSRDFGRVYVIRNTKDNKVYVGQTTRPLAIRWAQHKSAAGRENTPLARAMREYGEAFFTIHELEACADQEALTACENAWMSRLKSLDCKYGYNRTPCAKSRPVAVRPRSIVR